MKFLKAMIGTIGEEKLFIASDAVEDRQGECIAQEGWDLTNFRANPVIQWAHNPNEPAIATAEKIGFKDINGSKKLVYSPVFHRKTPMSNYIADLVEAGVIKASSVGFKPLEMEGNTYTKSELLEISFVNVPANQNALSLGLSKGYDFNTIKTVMPDIKKEEVETGKITEEEKNIESNKNNLDVDLIDGKKINNEKEKGAILEELSSEQTEQMKYEKMEEFWNITHAFCSVYFNEETPVDQFETLLQETITLLQNLTDGITETTEDKSIKPVKIERIDLFKFLTINNKEDSNKEVIETEEEKSVTERVEDLESIVLGLSDGFKKIDSEITEKFSTFKETTNEIMIEIKNLSSQSKTEEVEEKGEKGRDPKTEIEIKNEKNRRLAMKALNRVVEILNKTK